MDQSEIQQKVKELQDIMKAYRQELRGAERELFRAISDYQKALDEEKLKQLRQSLS